MEILEKKSGKSQEKLTALNSEISELNDKLDELKEACESKDSGVNDQSPLVRIKAALQQMKSEISSFEMRIGVVSHSLLRVRILQSDRKRLAAIHKAKQRRGKSKKSADDDNDSVLSYDD